MNALRNPLRPAGNGLPPMLGPPPAYDHRKLLLPSSIELICQRWPALADLAESGTLLAVPRPDNYEERREDGYQEPRLVLLIGTAHLSQTSAEDVRRVVLATQPQNVVVEVCKSRSAQLYSSSSDEESINKKAQNPLALSGGSLLGSFQRSMELGGSRALLLRLVLGSLSSRMSAQLGVTSGAEFAAAREAADEMGAQIVLGDRPIEVTLRRAWDALSWEARLQLAAELSDGMRSAQGPSGALATADALEKLKDDDAVTWMLTSLAEKYPAAVGPLVHERDQYLAWSLKRSKAVNKTDTVVGVLGRGHLRGVCYALTHDQEGLRFKDLVGSRSGNAASAAKKLAIETAVLTAAWVAWTQLIQQ